jgi:hypothetical protein
MLNPRELETADQIERELAQAEAALAEKSNSPSR